MAKDMKLHLVAYGLRRKGLQFDDILTELETKYGPEAPSKAVLHRWASRESSCTCPWHDWAALLENDSEINHSRAVALHSAGHDIVTISNTLKLPVEMIEAWGKADYPCYCGSHGWNVANVPEVIHPQIDDNFPVIPSSNNVEDASQSAILTILDAASNAVRRGDVVPRSWKDVLDTLKIVDQILNPSIINASGATQRTPGGMRLTESRSITIPQSESGTIYLQERSKKLKDELMSAVGIDTERVEE